MLELDRALQFEPARDAEFFAEVPARPGVLLINLRSAGEAHGEPYLVRTANLRRAAERLLGRPDASSRRLNLRDVAAGVLFRVTGSRLEQSLTHYQQARRLFPQRYGHLVRLRPPVLLKVNLRSEYPRCYVTRRIPSDGGFYMGPFAARKSTEEFASRFLDLFKVRRCQIRIRRDPQFPGCIYSEMKMCLAPCFAGCTADEYDGEAARMVESLASRGQTLCRALELERDAASEALEFERAATVQKRIEKMQSAFRGWPAVARRIEDLHAVILQRAAEKNSVAVFPVQAGVIADPFFLNFSEHASQERPAEVTLREHLEQAEASSMGALTPRGAAAEIQAPQGLDESLTAADQSPPGYRQRFALKAPAADLREHLSLLARWYYSNPREGKIFFRDSRWPSRRILRACSRILGAGGQEPEAAGVSQAPEA